MTYLDIDAIDQRRKAWKESGRCSGCGIPLNELTARDGQWRCFDCEDRLNQAQEEAVRIREESGD